MLLFLLALAAGLGDVAGGSAATVAQALRLRIVRNQVVHRGAPVSDSYCQTALQAVYQVYARLVAFAAQNGLLSVSEPS